MRRRLLLLECGLFAMATVALGYVAYVQVSSWMLNERRTLEIERIPHPHQSMAAIAPREGALLGEIEIPRLGASAVILEGTADGTLRRAVGHISGTALPGQAGNICLAGHRDSFFRPLRRISRGDEISITTAGGLVVYRVEDTSIVSPEDVQILEPTRTETLTLITCYPFNVIGPAPRRFIVRARRVS